MKKIMRGLNNKLVAFFTVWFIAIIMVLSVSNIAMAEAGENAPVLPKAFKTIPREMYILSGLPMFGDGLVAFYDQEKEAYGYQDINGNVIIPARFCIARQFSEGLAYAGENLLFGGYINTKGEYIFPPVFTDGGKFINGFAIVSLGAKTSRIIDQKGHASLEKDYDAIYYKEGGYYCHAKGKTEIRDENLKLLKTVDYRLESLINYEGKTYALFDYGLVDGNYISYNNDNPQSGVRDYDSGKILLEYTLH